MEGMEERIQQLQTLEQTLQSFSAQKQAMQLQLTEVEGALKELQDYNGSAPFKVIGPVMIQTEKETLHKELEEKKELLNVKLGSIDKQEVELKQQFEEMQQGILKDLQEQQKA